ncbi:hypothetical protein AB0F72_13005 [Actinoplanes sp. NPDC023936]|uniref:hypothetical protein n=1 Tax=Actinoplanes sp. NPDC023936 TaxID=3154910 RepID=UPI0034034609
MRVLLVGRLAAATLSVTTFVFLFLHSSWRADNPFLVPDLILCAVLALGASLPARAAAATLAIGFAYAAGVLTVSVFSYAVTGDLGAPSLIGALVAAAAAVAMARGNRPGSPTSRPASPSLTAGRA